MNTYIEKLDKLISAKKVKGHKITKREAEEFTTALTALIRNEEGFSSNAEKYFYEGFNFSGAKPVVQWILESNDTFAALQAVLKGSLFGKDSNATFRILISLLANLLKAELPDKNLICPVIKSIPLQSKNKDKKTFGDAHRTLLKYFVDELDVSINYPPLSKLNVKPQYVQDFVALMDELVERLKTTELSKKQMIVLTRTVAWLHPETNTAPEECYVKPTGINTQNERAKEAMGSEERTRIEEQPKDPYEILTNMLKQAYTLASQLRVLAASAEKNAAATSASLKSEIEILKGAQEELQQQIASLDEQLIERNTRISSMNFQIRELEKHVEEMKSEIAEKETEIAQRTQMIEALSRDRTKQANEQANRLASTLKVEYKDFKDAEGLEMNVDLGENMREQLRNIFAILMKAGITLD